MRAPKVSRQCDGCHAKKRSRYRLLVDRYLCDDCCYRTQSAPPGMPPGTPMTQGARETGQSLMVEGYSSAHEELFDLEHLKS